MNDATIKDNLLKKRIELGYTQTEMARRLEMSLTAYRKLESGNTRMLNEHISRFAEMAGMSLAALVNGFEPISPEKAGLEEMKESYERKIRILDEGYAKEIAELKTQIKTLNDRLQDKDDIIAMDKKLILHYEKELKGGG